MRLTRILMRFQVKEALMTSALLKLPQSMSRARKEERVEQILTELVSICHLYVEWHSARVQILFLLPLAILADGMIWQALGASML